MAYRFWKANVASESILKGFASVFFQRCALSVAAEVSQTAPIAEKRISSFRTVENNPVNHDASHLYRYYTVPESVKNQIFHHGGLPVYFTLLTKTFKETSLLVRDPAVELLHYLKKADYTRPAVRYVVYGDYGCGKSTTLAHILHFGSVSGFILVHIAWLPNWIRACQEVSLSEKRSGYVDLNMDAAAWLVHFKRQNGDLLVHPDLRLSKDYVWNKRETTQAGAPLSELVEFGVKRVKYASECIIALLKEIKEHSTAGRCKTLVVIDGFNAFFHPKTRIITEDKVQVPPSKVSITEAFLDITNYNWCNGAVVVSVDKTAVAKESRESNLPLYLLGKEGFEHMDPFVPICVGNYNEKEIESVLDYYVDRRWLQHPKCLTEEGRRELKFLCGMNPRNLMHKCGPM